MFVRRSADADLQRLHERGDLARGASRLVSRISPELFQPRLVIHKYEDDSACHQPRRLRFSPGSCES